MKPFLNDHFLLQTRTAQHLYHNHAKQMPIIDYHCHLSPQQIADDVQFENLTQIWLAGDHYKWRAMRANGINECYITGDKSDTEKFMKWADTVPYTMRNPLYHWTHLELSRYFDVNELLDKNTATHIYESCNAKLQTKAYSVRNLLRRMNVKIVCTTDDPTDTLEHHQKIKVDDFEIKVYPAWRPDAAMNVSDSKQFHEYVKKLQTVAKVHISNFSSYLTALKKRHDFFAEMGCRLSDHGLEYMDVAEYTFKEIENIFIKTLHEETLTQAEQEKFRAAMLVFFAEMDHEKGWAQQFHLGAIRNNNKRKLRELGPDTGWDSIGDFLQAKNLSQFFSKLDDEQKLTKTILYNVNPTFNEVFATMTGNFNDGSLPGKMQWGAAWWHLDQKEGIENQLNTLSNMGLLSRFVGMLTDSRSFLSYPRHEYFRRILCNLFGNEVENGELPPNMPFIEKMIEDICYNNALEYFGFDL